MMELVYGKTWPKTKRQGKYKSDFLRGLFDGDGYSYWYWDKRWASSFMLYIGFVSASPKFILWLRESIKAHLGFVGHVTTVGRGKTCFQLKYAKSEALNSKNLCITKK